ncbi:PDC sensor domain-containing protein [Derxia lacustris]|uniref:PDC sensor domain-containing protein n=1 Tax=Derxia lacustris TaxID=764842 RepID=UPI000A175293|nr:cache domain-containing protein [Derxia lacustris]
MSANPTLASPAAQPSVNVVRFGLRQRLLIVFLLATLLPIGGLWLAVRSTFIDEARNTAEARLKVIGESARQTTDDWLSETRTAIELLAAMPASRALSAPQITRVLQAAGRNPRLDTVYLWHLIGPDGANLARSDERDPAGFSYGERSYVRDVLAGQPFAVEVGMGKTRVVPTVILAVPVHGEAGNLAGVMAAATSLDKIARHFAEQRHGMSNQTFLVHADGRLIVHTDHGLGDRFEDFSAHPAYLAARRGQTGLAHYTDGNREQLAWIEKTNQGWFVITQLATEEVLSGVEHADRIAIAILVVTLIGVAVLTWLVAGSLARPIVELTAIADRISRGALDDEIPAVNRSDEIGSLAQAIARLSKSMKLAMSRLRRA